MDFKFSIDQESIKKDIAKTLEHESKIAVRNSINAFFKDGSEHYRTPKGEAAVRKVKGIGTTEIEEMVASKFLDESFQKRLNSYFDENWERILGECMEKAIQHKANALVFAKTKEK